MMSIKIAEILGKELTCLPEILSSYFGLVYRNALCNGCSWLFFIWFVLHSGHDYALNEVLRKLKYKEYNRIRLKHSLWYLGFYCTAFVHTSANFFRNQMDLFGFRRMDATSYDVFSSDVVMSFMVLFTFFLHSAFWEVIEYDSKTLFLSYILLCSLWLTSFVMRILEVALTLTAFISIAQVSIQSAKILYVVTEQNNTYLRITITVFFGMGVCSFCLSYLVGVPLIFLIPFFRKIVSAHLPSGFIFLISILGGWYVSEIGNSPLFKLLGHWLFHSEKSKECCGNLIECSLFPPRTDVAFNLQQLRKEIKEREERKLSLRRTSKKGVLVQTIKCMVSLRRKINAKRAAFTQNEEDAENTNTTENCEIVNNDEFEKKSLSSPDDSIMIIEKAGETENTLIPSESIEKQSEEETENILEVYLNEDSSNDAPCFQAAVDNPKPTSGIEPSPIKTGNLSE